MWDLINEELGKDRTSMKNIKIEYQGAEIHDPIEVADKFNEFYSNMADNLLNAKLPSKNSTGSNLNVKIHEKSIFLAPTTEEELVGIIKDFKNKKSTGIDGFSDYVIKRCYVYIVQPLTYIINLSLSTGYFPESLKTAKIKPLFNLLKP